MLEHLNRKKVLRAKILMQNVLKGQIPPRNFTEMYRLSPPVIYIYFYIFYLITKYFLSILYQVSQ